MVALAPSVLVPAMVVPVAVLVEGHRRNSRALMVPAKTCASLVFLAAGLSRWSPGDVCGTWLLAGLVLCLGGDLLLLGERTFSAGLAMFLAGHIAYLSAFHRAMPVTRWSPLLLLPLAAAAVAVTCWLWSRLGRYRLPVAAYIATITTMAWGATAATLSGAIGLTTAPGALLFFLSDIAVARQRFVQQAFVNRAWGLPAYYAGQLLLALAIGTGQACQV